MSGRDNVWEARTCVLERLVMTLTPNSLQGQPCLFAAAAVVAVAVFTLVALRCLGE